MSDEINKTVRTTGIKIFLFLAFVAIAILCYNTFVLYQKLEICNAQLEYYAEQSIEFHENLYASQTGSYSQGTHTLSISDVYYNKYFKSNVNEK